MDPDQVLILAPDGALRTGLEEVVLRLGRRAAAHHMPWAHEVPSEGPVILLDLREGDEDRRRMAPALRTDPRPLLIVAERPSPMMAELQNRPGGLALLTGAESDGGYRVALRLCDALHRRELVGAEHATPALTAL